MLFKGIVREAVLQLGQGDLKPAAPLCCGVGPVLFQREIADDAADIGSQRVGSLGRDTVPCAEIGVVDTFLRILRVVQNVVSDFEAQVAVLSGQLRDGLL